MKKIISLLAALTVMASATSMVFAAIPGDAPAQIPATVTVEDTGDTDPDAGTLYALTVDLDNLGTVTHNKISATKFSGTKVVQFNFNINGEDLLFVEASGELSTTGFGGSGDSSEFTGIYASYLNTTAKTAFPTTATATSCEGAITIQFYAQPGTAITLTEGKVGYGTYNATTGAAEGAIQYRPVSFSPSSITLGGSVEPPVPTDPTVSGTLDGKYTNGYIWTATVSPNDNDITSFEASFTDKDTGAIKNASIFNASALEKYGTAADFSFKVGLKTTKTLSGATFGVNGLDAVAVPVN